MTTPKGVKPTTPRMIDLEPTEPEPVELEFAAPELAEPELADPVVPEPQASGPHPLGRIVHDERGNAVWKWRGETSTSDTTSGVLKHIDARDLSVEGQGSGSKRSIGNRTSVPEPGGGYDPYNQGQPRAGKPVPPKKGSRDKR